MPFYRSDSFDLLYSASHYQLVVADRRPDIRCAKDGCGGVHPRLYFFDSLSYDFAPSSKTHVAAVLHAKEALLAGGIESLLKGPDAKDGLAPDDAAIKAFFDHVEVCRVKVRVFPWFLCQSS
jgi:hypothetical protein